MAKLAATVILIMFSALCVFHHSMSLPQYGTPIGGQFGYINQTTIGGNGANGGNVQPYGEYSNQTSEVPGSGYPGHYSSIHMNDTAPTPPPMSGGEVNIQEASIPTSTCQCGQVGNIQEISSGNQNGPETPAETPAEAPADTSADAPAETPESRK